METDDMPGFLPTKVQIRNREGSVIASTPVKRGHTVTFCPSIEFCVASTLNGHIWFFDHEKADYALNTFALPEEHKQDKEAFQNYIEGRNRTFSSHGLDFPGLNKDEALNFKKIPALFLIADPLLIIINHYTAIIALFLLYYLPLRMINTRQKEGPTKTKKAFTGLIRVIAASGFLMIALISLLFMTVGSLPALAFIIPAGMAFFLIRLKTKNSAGTQMFFDEKPRKGARKRMH